MITTKLPVYQLQEMYEGALVEVLGTHATFGDAQKEMLDRLTHPSYEGHPEAWWRILNILTGKFYSPTCMVED